MGKGAERIGKLASKERRRLRAQVAAFKKGGTAAVDVKALLRDLERMVAFDDQQKAEMDAFRCEQWLASLNDFLIQNKSASDVYFEMEAEEGSDEDSDAYEHADDQIDEMKEEMLALHDQEDQSGQHECVVAALPITAPSSGNQLTGNQLLERQAVSELAENSCGVQVAEAAAKKRPMKLRRKS